MNIMILLKVVAANEEVSQRSKEGLAQLHRFTSSFGLWQTESICGIMVTRFYSLIKLEKVEEEEMEALLENLPDEYAAMLGEPHQQILPTSSHPHFHSPDVLVRHPGFQDDWH